MLLAGLGGDPAVAAEAPAGQVTNVVGAGSLARAAAPAAVPVRQQDSLFVGDRIDTREQSVVRILLGGKVTVTIRELSSLTVREEPSRASVELHGGKVAVQVNPALMRKGDAVHVITPNAVAAVRGSILIAELAGADDAQESTLSALEASLPIVVASRAELDRGQPLQASQAVVIRGRGATARLGPVRALSADEVTRLRQLLVLPTVDRRTLRDRPGASGPSVSQPLPGTGIRSAPPRPPSSSK